jgi:O-antigen/teichoic acid export membrane protein
VNAIHFKKILLQGIISAILSFLTFAFGFLRVYYFSKKLPMEDFGVFSLLLLVSAFLMYLFTFGSFQFLFKYVAERHRETRAAFWAAIFVRHRYYGSKLCAYRSYVQ